MIQIKSTWGQKIAVKVVQWWIKKKYGYKVRIDLKEFNIVDIGDEATLTLNMEVKMKKDDLEKYVAQKIGE